MTETATATRRLLASYRAAPDETVAAGRAWYPSAERESAQLARMAPAGVGRVGTAAVIAALSPRTQWAQNLTGARRAIRAAASITGDPVFGDADGIAAAVYAAAAPYALGDSIRKAGRILAGERPAAVLGGPKVLAFWRNLCGEVDPITLDVWALRATFGEWLNPTPRRLRVAERAHRCAAERVGELPRDFQAIVWLQTRGDRPADAPGYRPAQKVEYAA